MDCVLLLSLAGFNDDDNVRRRCHGTIGEWNFCVRALV